MNWFSRKIERSETRFSQPDHHQNLNSGVTEDVLRDQLKALSLYGFEKQGGVFTAQGEVWDLMTKVIGYGNDPLVVVENRTDWLRPFIVKHIDPGEGMVSVDQLVQELDDFNSRFGPRRRKEKVGIAERDRIIHQMRLDKDQDYRVGLVLSKMRTDVAAGEPHAQDRLENFINAWLASNGKMTVKQINRAVQPRHRIEY